MPLSSSACTLYHVRRMIIDPTVLPIACADLVQLLPWHESLVRYLRSLPSLTNEFSVKDTHSRSEGAKEIGAISDCRLCYSDRLPDVRVHVRKSESKKECLILGSGCLVYSASWTVAAGSPCSMVKTVEWLLLVEVLRAIFLFLEANRCSSLVAEFSHFNIFDA